MYSSEQYKSFVCFKGDDFSETHTEKNLLLHPIDHFVNLLDKK